MNSRFVYMTSNAKTYSNGYLLNGQNERLANGWETDLPAVKNGFKYRSNSHGKFSNGCCKRSNCAGKFLKGWCRPFEWLTKNFEQTRPEDIYIFNGWCQMFERRTKTVRIERLVINSPQAASPSRHTRERQRAKRSCGKEAGEDLEVPR